MSPPQSPLAWMLLSSKLYDDTDNMLSYLKKVEEPEEEMYEYEKCSCGGDMTPMFDEFPCWITFYRKCDSRNENPEYSPLPY